MQTRAFVSFLAIGLFWGMMAQAKYKVVVTKEVEEERYSTNTPAEIQEVEESLLDVGHFRCKGNAQVVFGQDYNKSPYALRDWTRPVLSGDGTEDRKRNPPGEYFSRYDDDG